MDSACSKTPKITFCLTILMDLNFSQFFWVQILSYLPLLQEGTTAGFSALGSSDNRPWIECTEPDNIIATETWLKPEIHDAELEMEDYSI